jgi:hypothetical protein
VAEVPSVLPSEFVTPMSSIKKGKKKTVGTF